MPSGKGLSDHLGALGALVASWPKSADPRPKFDPYHALRVVELDAVRAHASDLHNISQREIAAYLWRCISRLRG